ncbi:pseudomurein-binding repeat protein [Methanobrevibacter cuticularis]|uniref:Pseudomurein-binding repeat protein n=1 Tax=Methanobrevibacter cuticularis TaxID=47311 RepID=A0A166CHQ8_9EURY|nr:pseudomurein-binding repeat-containing protein [Methanobrevibacter cuticularis]KZX14520.1 pseudomurein-binding repeat protein [Methanobrevibacter cuticularis]
MTYLTLDEYREMVNEIIEIRNTTGEMPEYAQICNITIPRENYCNMIERVNKFILEMGRSPRSIEIG